MTRTIRAAVIVLALIGVAAGIGRSVFPGDLTTRSEPFRTAWFRLFDRQDPFAASRPAELRLVDGRFGAHPGLTRLHVVPGAVFLALAPFQFSRRVGTRFVRLHRASGYVLLAAGLLSVIPAFYFGLRIPYGGRAEAAAIALFGGLFLLALGRGYAAIRRKDTAAHREWMMRAFAIALGISTVRVVAMVFDITLTPAGYTPPALFVASIWAGWVITLGAAELWIRHTRPHAAGSLAT